MLHVACCTWWDLYWRRIWQGSLVHINHKPQISVCTCPARVCSVWVACLPAQLQLDCWPGHVWVGAKIRETDRQTGSAGRSNGLSYRRTVEIIHSKYDRLALQQAINLLGWDSTSEYARVLSWLPNNCTSQGGAATTSMAPKCAETIKITFLGKRNPWHGCQKSRQTDKSTNKQCQTMSGYTRGGGGASGGCTKTV